LHSFCVVGLVIRGPFKRSWPADFVDVRPVAAPTALDDHDVTGALKLFESSQD
jgi:hypothetical protein